ncbi:response regulator transcription factor [Draconibacterium sp. IB214405]|uniref:response regulator transcription factor n=1 Tax=Draconibacterium sp. IB214405 TaxID=3097352 RepID=UPI002A12C7E5|nr:response regulator transcription factor [Draconibacterium sp. IB214405]MDX8339366.1 response regulator transcription factor [Draconibacterium sp. IB214405]
MLPNEQIKILVAYEQKLVADCLESFLSHHKNFQIVGVVENDENLFDSITELRPDLIIFEFMLWSIKYIDYMSNLNRQFPQLKIILLSELISRELMAKIMPFINGYIVKTCPAEKIINAIYEIQNAGKYLCPKAVEKFFTCTKGDKSNSTLTSREKQILGTWITEETSNAVADTLNISESTVRTHLKNIREKLGSVNHLQMMIYACQHNLIGKEHKPVCPNCRFFISPS